MTDSPFEKHEILFAILTKCGEFGEAISAKLVAISIMKSGLKNVFPHIQMIKIFYPDSDYSLVNSAFNEISG